MTQSSHGRIIQSWSREKDQNKNREEKNEGTRHQGTSQRQQKNVIAAAGYVTSAAKRGRLGPYGNRVQVTYDSESGAVWATEDTRSTYTVDTASQVSAFFKSPIKAQKLLDRLAEAWEEKQENRKWMAEINGDFD